MKHIIKRPNCPELDQWKEEFADDPNLGYRHPGFPRQNVLTYLLEDQGNICAYTMQSICSESCHIEHIKPQTVCRNEDRERSERGQEPLLEEIEWNNMLACFPQPRAEDPGYGAVKRGSWWDENYLSPLEQGCQDRFRFSCEGKIDAADEGDAQVVKTIEIMALKNKSLTEQREYAILEFGLHPLSDDPLPLEEAQAIVDGRWRERTSTGFIKFCVAIRDAAREYLAAFQNTGLA